MLPVSNYLLTVASPALLRRLPPCIFGIALNFISVHAQFDFDILGELYPEDFFQAPNISQITLSPSGSQYAYAYSNDIQNNLFVVDIESGTKRSFEGHDSSKDFINFLAWKSETGIVFQTKHGNLYFLDLELETRDLVFSASRTVRFANALLWGNYTLPRVISLLHDEPKSILVSAFNEKGHREVYKIPINKGNQKNPKVFVAGTRGINSWFADPSGKVRLGVRSDKNGHVFFTQDDSKSWIQFRNAFDNETELNIDLERDNFLQRRDYFAGFDFDPKFIFIASNRLSDTTTMYKFDITSGKIKDTIANDPEYDFFSIAEGSANLWLSDTRKKPIGIPYHRDKPSVLWLDDNFKAVQKKVDSHLPDSSNIPSSWNKNETRFIINSIRSDKPTGFYLYDHEKETLERIATQNEVLDEKALRHSQPFQFKSTDGLSIRGYITLAESESGEIPPLVVLPHGGPWARDYWGYDPSIQWLAHNGLSVLQVNYRGSIGFGYSHYIASKNEFGWGIQNDINESVDWAIANGYADPENLAIMGFSYGAYAALLSMVKYPGKYKCAVAMSGIYDLFQVSKNIKRQTRTGLAYEHFREMVGRKWKDRDLLEEISPALNAHHIKDPILLVHGKLDQVASFEQATRMKDALDTAGNKTELIEIDDEGHGFYLPKNQITVFGDAVDFLKRHL